MKGINGSDLHTENHHINKTATGRVFNVEEITKNCAETDVVEVATHYHVSERSDKVCPVWQLSLLKGKNILLNTFAN